MQVLVKAALSLAVILSAAGIAGRFPSASGLISVMPLTGALVLVWVSLENGNDPATMQVFSRGALWGCSPAYSFTLQPSSVSGDTFLWLLPSV